MANTAAKAVAIRTAEELKAPVAVAKASKPAVKPVPKVPAKLATKLATKAENKAEAKTPAKVPVKPVAKVKAKAPVSAVAKSVSKKPVVISKPIVAAPVKEKAKKPKLVRDSFTMPEAEYAVLSEVKKACIAAGIEVKKSQLLRVGLVLLKKTPVSALKTLVEELPALKAGRPKLG
ncbi:hypothetical protein H8K33_19355 [Undibacterium amnicola]|uniref:Uncharacterized protein n=1 Tax=Undibacterium amnicola TaxID=1834038 RepID=A0ABR6XW09_9BURK|nr:hypothetical protein [Undibacterium amnicola]